MKSQSKEMSNSNVNTEFIETAFKPDEVETGIGTFMNGTSKCAFLDEDSNQDLQEHDFGQ